MTTLSNVAKDYRMDPVVVQPNFGDGSFNELLKPILQKAGYLVEVIDAECSSAQKASRISDCLEPVMNQHKLVANKSLILKDYKSTEKMPFEEVKPHRLLYQLTCITKDEGFLVNHDRIDALALGLHYWTEHALH